MVPIQSDEENRRGQGKAPPSNLGHDQPLAPLRDRQERHARRRSGEFLPLRAMRSKWITAKYPAKYAKSGREVPSHRQAHSLDVD
jgi:hypothetical protein